MTKKILLITPNLNIGGAQKVLLSIAKYFNENKNIHVCLLVINRGVTRQKIPENINVKHLNCRRTIYSIFPLFYFIKQNNPTHILSTLNYINFIMLILKVFLPKGITYIVREAGIVTKFLESKRFSFMWRMMYNVLYPTADKIICQSDFMEKDLNTIINVKKNKLHKIYNPINLDTINEIDKNEMVPFRTNKLNIVSCSRLVHDKKLGFLIERFSELVRKNKDAHLWILGDGPAKNDLIDTINKLNIYENVHLVGYKKNPIMWFKLCDLFIFTSNHEGFPNVLLEALASKCPTISLAHPGGTIEIFEKLKIMDRWVNDISWNDKWFKKMNPGYFELLKNNFGEKVIMEKYFNLFNS